MLLCPQYCICSQGYTLVALHPGTANQTKGCVLEVSSFDAHKTLIVASVTAVSGVVLAVAVAASLAWMLRVQIAAFTLQRAKKRGPPGMLLSLCRPRSLRKTFPILTCSCQTGKECSMVC